MRMPAPQLLLSSTQLRARGQAMVEFGLIALLFCLLLFGIADFGMLLNAWINIGSGSAAAARQAGLGATLDQIDSAARGSSLVPGLTACGISELNPCVHARKVIVTYTSDSGTTYRFCRGFYDPPPSSTYTPVVGGKAVTLNGQTLVCLGEPASGFSAQPGYQVSVAVLANTFEVSTPLVRPFFGCTDGTKRHCFVPLLSSTTARYEGGQVL